MLLIILRRIYTTKPFINILTTYAFSESKPKLINIYVDVTW